MLSLEREARRAFLDRELVVARRGRRLANPIVQLAYSPEQIQRAGPRSCRRLSTLHSISRLPPRV